MMDGSRSRLADDEIIRNRAICNQKFWECDFATGIFRAFNDNLRESTVFQMTKRREYRI